MEDRYRQGDLESLHRPKRFRRPLLFLLHPLDKARQSLSATCVDYRNRGRATNDRAEMNRAEDIEIAVQAASKLLYLEFKSEFENCEALHLVQRSVAISVELCVESFRCVDLNLLSALSVGAGKAVSADPTVD